MSRNLNGFINATEVAYFERLENLERLNNRLQALAILQVQADLMDTIQNRWEWFESLPDEYTQNELFVDNFKEELRQEASQLIDKQKEMGMDKAHLKMLEEMLEIN